MIHRISVLTMIFAILFMACPSSQKAYKDQLAEMGIDFNENSFANSVIQGNTKAVQLFLKAGMSPDINSDSLTPLLEAARRGHSDVAAALIKAGANVNAQDPYGVSVLMFASICGSSELMEMLIERGADVNAKDVNGRTALIEALTTENDIPVSVMKSLLNAGADPNARISGEETALMLTAAGDIEILRMLIEAGADVNAQDENGSTALMRAAPYPENASLLKSAGATK